MCVCFHVVSECVAHVPVYTHRDRKRTLGVFLYPFPPLFPETNCFSPPHLALAALGEQTCCYAQNATWTPDLGPPPYPYPLTPHPIPTKQ